MHTLIPNPDPALRILLHRSGSGSLFVTVEELETDAIGSPQWRPGDDSRTEKIRKRAALALIAHAKPSAVRSTAPVVLGTCTHDATTYRCTTHRLDGVLVLVIEHEDLDAAGMTRWVKESTASLTDSNGESLFGLVDADNLIDCLFRD
jgi:hypothetical protein